jgi:phage head maturation protease
MQIEESDTLPSLQYAYAPLVRIDIEKREIEGILSDEQIDTYGTIFDYDAMKAAVQRWIGNIREQHDDKKAVGRRISATFDDEKRQVILRSYISKGAPETWEKLLDGTLSGYSIGVYRYSKPAMRIVGNQTVPCYTDFDLAEVSVVDAPSNPGAATSGLIIYRMDGFADAAFEFIQEEEPCQEHPFSIFSSGAENKMSKYQSVFVSQNIEKDKSVTESIKVESDDVHGQTDMVSGSSMHEAIQTLLRTCTCKLCQNVISIFELSENGEDVIDVSESTYELPQTIQSDLIRRAIHNATQQTFDEVLSPAIRQLRSVTARLASVPEIAGIATQLDTLLDSQKIITELVQKIAKQEMPGGPILRAADRTLSINQQSVMDASANIHDGTLEQTDLNALQKLARMGLLTPEQQTVFAAAIIRQKAI